MEKNKCPHCDKGFEGFSKKQVEHFLKQHILAKHPEKVKFEEPKKK